MTVRALFSMGVNVLGGIYANLATCMHVLFWRIFWYRVYIQSYF